MFRRLLPCLLTLLCVLWATAPQAAVKEYDLTIAQKQVNISGKPATAMTINGSIPGPVLHFTEGDLARIRVHNKMPEDTSIHWHGILLPPGMDGVPNISFPPIKPGQTFVYEFPIRQSGTYWYHSHSGLQEQNGLYGAIVIQPRQAEKPTRPEYVLMLSDWTDQSTASVIHDLKRGSEFFAIQKGGAQSILGAAKLGMLGDYFKRELLRMPAMDLADVAYDRFLINGQPQISIKAKPGQTVRLRVINGGASTFFLLEFAGGPMTIISADGLPVEPVKVKRLLIGIAETYDVLVKLPAKGTWEFRATSHDGSAHASAWLGSGMKHPAPEVPKPNLYHSMGALSAERVLALTPAGSMGMPDDAVQAGKFDRPGMMGGAMQMEMRHGAMKMSPAQDHSGMKMPQAKGHDMPAAHQNKDHAKIQKPDGRNPYDGKPFTYDFTPLASDVASAASLAVDGRDPRRPGPPYAKLRATKSTSLGKDRKVRTVRLTLDGDMGRYVWLLNNKRLLPEDTIRIKEGEVVRFIVINRTMMHHPMHLHGHFFRVINGQGERAPLKHTVDVAPMSTTVIEFDANEKGDWFFHCHLLYHMKAGMARLVHYRGYQPPPEVMAIRPNLYEDSWYAWLYAELLSNMTEGFVRAANTRQILSLEWEVGWQNVEETDWEGTFTWAYSFNRFFTAFIGANSEGENSEEEKTRGIVGLTYLLPLNFESRLWLDTDAGWRVELDKEWALTPRLGMLWDVRYDSHERWEGSVGLSYVLAKNLSVMVQWHSKYAWGAGLLVSF